MSNITTIRGMQLEIIVEDYNVIVIGGGKRFVVDQTADGCKSRFRVGGRRIEIALDDANRAIADQCFAEVAENVASKAREDEAYEAHYNRVIDAMNQ